MPPRLPHGILVTVGSRCQVVGTLRNMPVDGPTVVAAVCYGLVVGWGLGLRREDRTLMLSVEGLTVMVGIVVWATGPETGSEAAVAAVALTLGGLAALLASAVLGRRRAPG